MKNLIIAGLFAFTFIVPENFNLQEFLTNAKTQGTTFYKIKKTDPTPDGYISLHNKNLKVTLYNSQKETPMLEATLQILVDNATSPVITTQDLIDAQWEIVKDTRKSLIKRFEALIIIEKIRRGE